MKDQKEYCKNLYKEYKELESKMPVVQELKRGQPYKLQRINPQDLTTIKDIAKKLVDKCRDNLDLDPEEWFEIENYK